MTLFSARATSSNVWTSSLCNTTLYGGSSFCNSSSLSWRSGTVVVSGGIYPFCRDCRASHQVIGSAGIVEDDAQREAPAGQQPAHSVPQVHAVPAAAAANGAIARGEDDRLALFQRRRLPARLRPRPLLQQQELAAGVILASPAEGERHLDGEGHVAVQVLVQAVVVACLVLQDQRRRARLPVLCADLQEVCQLRRIGGVAQRLRPAAGDRREAGIEARPQLLHQLRQRTAEVLVLARPEAVASHIDPTSEAGFVLVQLDQRLAFGARQQRAGGSVPEGVQRLLERGPIQPLDPPGDSAHPSASIRRAGY